MKPISNLTAQTALMLAVLMCPITCSRESTEKTSSPAAEPVAQSLQQEQASRSLREGSGHTELPAIGEVVIRRSGETVTVLANHAALTRLVRHLSHAFRFELALFEFEDRPVTLSAVDSTLGDVLEQVLEGVPYVVRYGVRNGRSRLAALAVGEKAGTDFAKRRPEERTQREEARKEEKRSDEKWEEEQAENAREEEERKERTPPLRADDAERREIFLAERANRQAARTAETFEGLESGDPETRQEAVQMLDPETPANVINLANIAAYDEDFRVRVAAVEQLELSGSRIAVEAVTGALWDPEAEVVVAAVKALRLLGDSTTVPMAEPLLAHENREVRDQARELVELLQEREPSE